MTLATAIVPVITGLAPIIGAQVAGLVSPFPVFGVVLAMCTHHTHGPAGAITQAGTMFAVPRDGGR